MADDLMTVEVDYKDLVKELEAFDKQMPNVARKLMRAVNTEAKKAIRRSYRSMGFHSKKPMEWGDAGYSKNLKSYADAGYKAKIMLKNDAFYYRFQEYGADVKPRNSKYLAFMIDGKFYRSKGFVIPAHNYLRNASQSVWGTSKASEIMEAQMQKEIDKKFKK